MRSNSSNSFSLRVIESELLGARITAGCCAIEDCASHDISSANSMLTTLANSDTNSFAYHKKIPENIGEFALGIYLLDFFR